MNHDGYRLNGGIGFSIALPILNMSFEESDTIDVYDNRNYGLSDNELSRLKLHLRNTMKRLHLRMGFRCMIHDSIIQSHVGFGSGSMIYLSCTEALLIMNHYEYSKWDVVSLSGRGGTSGIGINTYFSGGFVLDTGVVNKVGKCFAPSSAYVSESIAQPLLLKKISVPEWQLGICIPFVDRKTEEEENTFFIENCPIEKEAVDDILYEAIYGVASALMERDYETLCKSVDAIQKTKWKSLERNLYGEELMNIESVIKKYGARCVGMSSLGPLLYFLGDNIDDIIDNVKHEIPSCTCFRTRFNNQGRIVKND